MSLDGGFGDVTDKNVLLFRNTTEKIAGVHLANGKDIWIVAHEWGNNKFRSYLATEDGIHLSPVINATGEVQDGDGITLGSKGNPLGQMKLSPDGRKIALAIWE